MKYLSVCSGIEAASVAWEPLGWTPIGFSEIDPFPSAVLAHRYPDVPNFGDFTAIDPADVVEADVLIGGTPCQAFSVAGLRKSLDDARGNLSLSFVRLADAIDDLRLARGASNLRILWENVPGVLSTNDNAFGCFLGALAGCDDAIVTPDGRSWPDAGVVDGPRRTVAWRVLDAQWFGVAQRRRRVFVYAVGGAGRWAAADALLPIGEGVSRHPPSRSKAREGVASTLTSRTPGGGGVDTRMECAGLISATVTAKWARGSGGPAGDEVQNLTVGTVSAKSWGGASWQDNGNLQVVAFDPTQITSIANGSNPQPGDPCHTLAKGAHPPAVCFEARIARNGRGAPSDVVPPLKAQSGETGKGDSAPLVAYQEVAGTLGARGNRSHTELEGHGAYIAESISSLTTRPYADNKSKDDKLVATFRQSSMTGKGTIGYDDGDVAKPCKTQMDGQMLQQNMVVRRLTPRECERLQGFPDDWTLIPGWKRSTKKTAVLALAAWYMKMNPHLTAEKALLFASHPDGPRYKAVGNSMAVPVIRWLGRRIMGAK